MNLKFSRRSFLLGAGASALALGGASAPRLARAAGGLVLATGKASPVNNVSKGDLKRLFLGEPVSVSGQNLTAFNLPPTSAERQLFEKLVLDMTPDQVAKHWIDRRIRGQGGAPKTAPSPDVLLKIAANFPGAIVYLPPELVSPAVKALTIEGKPSTDPGYLLKG